MQISSEDFSTHLQHCHFFFNFFLSFVKQRCRIDPIIARNQPMQIIPHSALVYANYPHPLQRCHIRSIQTRTPPSSKWQRCHISNQSPIESKAEAKGGGEGGKSRVEPQRCQSASTAEPPPSPPGGGKRNDFPIKSKQKVESLCLVQRPLAGSVAPLPRQPEAILGNVQQNPHCLESNRDLKKLKQNYI